MGNGSKSRHSTLLFTFVRVPSPHNVPCVHLPNHPHHPYLIRRALKVRLVSIITNIENGSSSSSTSSSVRTTARDPLDPLQAIPQPDISEFDPEAAEYYVSLAEQAASERVAQLRSSFHAGRDAAGGGALHVLASLPPSWLPCLALSLRAVGCPPSHTDKAGRSPLQSALQCDRREAAAMLHLFAQRSSICWEAVWDGIGEEAQKLLDKAKHDTKVSG